MILDTSAIVCILHREPEASTFSDMIEAADHVSVSAGTVLEASLVLGPSRQQVLDTFLAAARAVVVPVDVTQLSTARTAHLRYGRGSGSRARLNFGDCFAYALAITTGEALLFKGEDFVHTDALEARDPQINHVPAVAHWDRRSAAPISGQVRPVPLPDLGAASPPPQHVLARNSIDQCIPRPRA